MQFKNIISKWKLSSLEEKRMRADVKQTLSKIDASLRKLRIDASAMLGGSAAKSTLLKGDFDVDLFVRFSQKYKDKNLSDLLAKALSQFRPARLNGSRDYFQFRQDGISYEVVPVLKIKSWKEALNVTDASPLHVDWVASKTKKNHKLIDEIILAKVFLKANRLYGAESYIGGFSGHVVDILIINYGSFLKFLKAASAWTPFMVVDVEKHYKGKKPDLNQSKIGPLILIDPVQPQRNAAAAVSLDTFNRTVGAAKKFLKNPLLSSFEREVLTPSKLKELARGSRLVMLELSLKKAKLDVNGAKIVKTLEFLSSKLSEADFKPLTKGWEWDKGSKAMLWLILDKAPLDKVRIHPGPPISMADHVAAFRKAYKKTFVKDGKIYAEVKREYTEPEKLVESLLEEPYLTEKFTRITRKP
jgi:tRNA nucleotidyltransferase (CCA-adding enzyme)